MLTDQMELADGLLHLDPVRTYPQRGAALIAKIARAQSHKLESAGDGEIAEEGSSDAIVSGSQISVPLRNGRQMLGMLHLYGAERPSENDLRLIRWGARMLARGMGYARRLADEGGRRGGEDVADALARSPLTPRERVVVRLLVSGASTRDIASNTGLTVATVNTYLKRIFSKLGVHSRVELVARFAGTAARPEAPKEAEPTEVAAS